MKGAPGCAPRTRPRLLPMEGAGTSKARAASLYTTDLRESIRARGSRPRGTTFSDRLDGSPAHGDQRACRDAGVPTFSPHDLRHRRISLLHHEGVHGRRSELASGSEASRRRPRRTPMCLWTIGRSIAQSYSSASARCTPRSTPRRAKPPCLQERSRPAAPILAHVVERSSLNYVGQERRKPTNRHRRHPYVDTLGSRRNRPRPVRPSRREPRGGQPVTVEPVPEDDCAGTTSYSATIASSFSGYPSAR